jgi:hypothetical protein
MSCWQKQCQDLRRFLKGWGANLKGQFRREREVHNGIMVRLDSRNEMVGLSDLEWRERYKAEKELMRLFRLRKLTGGRGVVRSGFWRGMRILLISIVLLMGGEGRK